MYLTCKVEGCLRPQRARGWCAMHYLRWRRSGDVGPGQVRIRAPGTGTIRAGGYIAHNRAGKICFEHIEIAERALGHKLPKGAEVHHVDENPSNNHPSNLVICPNREYHLLLHQRMKGL